MHLRNLLTAALLPACLAACAGSPPVRASQPAPAMLQPWTAPDPGGLTSASSADPAPQSTQPSQIVINNNMGSVRSEPVDYFFVNFSAGELNYTDSKSGPVDDTFAFGISADWSKPGQLGWEIGGLFSSTSRTLEGDTFEYEAEGSTTEVYAGPRYNFRTLNLEALPFVGAGLSYQWVDRQLTDQDGIEGFTDGEGSALAAYAHAGVRWFISSDATIGFDWRYTFPIGDQFSFQDSAALEVDPGYHMFSFFLGLQL